MKVLQIYETKIYNSSLYRLLLMTLGISWLFSLHLWGLFPFFFSELIKRVQFGSLDLNAQSEWLCVSTSFPAQWHMHRFSLSSRSPPALPPRSSVKSFWRAVSSFLRWLKVGASWCHHLVGKVPRVPRVF